MIISAFDLRCMERAIALSERGFQQRESPFGAVLANTQDVIAEGSNQTRSTGNPTRHAEIEALDQFFARRPTKPQEPLTLYTSCEPCLMCLGAAHYSGIGRIVFGVTVREILRFGSDDPDYSVEPVATAAGLSIQIIPGVHRERALAVLQRFYDEYGAL